MLPNIAFASFSSGATPRQGRQRSLRGSQCFRTVGVNYSGLTWFRNVAVAIPHTVTEVARCDFVRDYSTSDGWCRQFLRGLQQRLRTWR